MILANEGPGELMFLYSKQRGTQGNHRGGIRNLDGSGVHRHERNRRRRSSPINLGTTSGGVHIKASSGVLGKLATSSYVITPATASYLGLTGMIGPSKPALSRLRISTAPMLVGLFDAPITATDRGRNRCFKLRMLNFSLLSLYDAS